MSPLKAVDKLRDQAKQLLRVLVRGFAEPDLGEREEAEGQQAESSRSCFDSSAAAGSHPTGAAA